MIDLSQAPRQQSERYRPSTVDEDPVERFRQAMVDCGLPVEHVDTSGKLARVDVDVKGDKAGWYVFYLGDICSGAFGNWKTELNEKWCSKSAKEFTDADRAEYARITAEAKRKRDDEEARLHAEAKDRANQWWSEAFDAVAHQYLTAKKVPSHGLKIRNKELLVPMFDESGQIVNVQRILPKKDENGKNKYFLFGGRKKGCFFFIQGNEQIAICEGYSTGASIHQLTGCSVFCAMDRGNLLPVSKLVRANSPTAQITICADDDRFSAGNPGVKDATEAAKSINAKLAIPCFDGLPGCDDAVNKLTDFNDLANVGGIELAKSQLTGQIAAPGKLPPLTASGSKVAGRLMARPKPLNFIFKFNDQGLIPEGVVGVLTATGGTGKTFFLLSLAMAGADGGNFGPINAPKPIKTLVIVGEDTQDELDRRLWDIGKGKFPDLLHAASVYGEVGPLMRLDGNNPVLADTWYWLDQTLTNHQGVKLLIIDPKSRFYGLDENSSEHATQWIQCLEILAKKHGVTILFSHHTSKQASDKISQNMSRGSSAIVDGCRWQGGLIRMDEETAKRFCVDNPRDYVMFDAPKSNYAADLPAAIFFKRGESGVLEYCEPGCELRDEMGGRLVEIIENDPTEYSKDELIYRKQGAGVASAMKEFFPAFRRRQDMEAAIDRMISRKKLFEKQGGFSTAGKPKTILSTTPF